MTAVKVWTSPNKFDIRYFHLSQDYIGAEATNSIDVVVIMSRPALVSALADSFPGMPQ